MKSLMWLLSCMLDNVSIRCDTDTHRDYREISRRTKHEGISYLTITLPAFASDFEKSLEQRQVTPELFLGHKKNGALPALLQGLLGLVFDPVTGTLLEEPNIDAIASVRQVCLMFKKVNLECSDKRVSKAYAGYHKCEYELSGLMERIPRDMFNLFGRVSDLLWSRVLSDLNFEIAANSLRPKHGPGATAERISGNQKYNLRNWHTRLEYTFPFDQYGMSNPCGLDVEDPRSRVKFIEPGDESPVRVITVPKTLKTPRIIAIEPVCMQYTQQSLAVPIMRMIESHPLTRGHINFTDQECNRDWAMDGSKTGSTATIDLSEASDRVHKDLVYRMLRTVPLVRDAAFACRTTRADVNGTIVPLFKFASMGSALCFPIEAMFFYTLLIVETIVRESLPVNTKSIEYASWCKFVYGDDLIVPVWQVETAVRTLELFGLKVNAHKTFENGDFRESCGMDAYDGEDVTPVYLRTMPPLSRHCVPEFVSFVAFANQLYTRGWWTAAARVREYVDKLFGPLPHVQDTSPCLGWIGLDKRYSIHKWDPDFMRPVVKGYVVTPFYRPDLLNGQGALMKFFLNADSKESVDEKHLERSVRPGSARIKYRWAPPY